MRTIPLKVAASSLAVGGIAFIYLLSAEGPNEPHRKEATQNGAVGGESTPHRQPGERQLTDAEREVVTAEEDGARTDQAPPQEWSDHQKRILVRCKQAVPEFSSITVTPSMMEELEELCPPYWKEMADWAGKRREILNQIQAERIAAGQFQEYPTTENVPRYPDSGELVHSSVKYDPVRKMDIRRIVRVYPGEHSELDRAVANLASFKAGFERALRGLMDRHQ